MNATQLLEHFDRLSEAPGAVPRLRRFILDLAVRGKLVAQEAGDKPAAALLKSVTSEWTRLQKAGQGKKGKVVTNLTEQDGPFLLPRLWAFVCLGEVLQMFNGRAFKPTEWQTTGLPIVRIQNLNNPNAGFNYCDHLTVDERHLIKDGEFLISWSGTPGTSFGAFIWQRGEGALNQHIFRCVQVGAAFEPRFLRLAINTQLDVLISQAQGGVGLQHVTKGTLEKLPLALPPLAEQHRIVAKVDELMVLCDQLEAAQQACEHRRDRLAAASLQRLNQPAADITSETQREHARFHLHNLPRLTTRTEHIKAMRQTILNLAVQGRLCPQNLNDEPIDALLERIRFEQRNAIESGLLKSRLPVNEMESNGCLFPIPKGWRWLKLANLITFGPQNGVSPKEIRDEAAPKAITLTATTSGSFQSAYYKHVELSGADCESYWLSTGDVLFQRGNTREYVGIAAIFNGPSRSFVFPDLMIRVRFSKSVEIRFAHMALVSPMLRNYFSSIATGASKTMPKINQAMLLNAPVPLPPQAEQHRIVAKVDALMALCDQLEAQLSTTQTDSRRLLEAVLNDALEVSTELAE